MAAGPSSEKHPQFGQMNNPSGWYRHYCLGLIFVVLVLNYVDRGILAVVLEDVKSDFQLNDLQLGLLSGPAFAVFYALMGIPFARWADMGNRRIVISVSLAIWSAMTALGGLAQNFTSLFLTRVGVGVGEAGAVPPTHSLASNYYPPEHHGKTASVLSFSVFVGSFLGLAGGGAILAATDWRTTLMAVGLPGVFIAVLAFFTLREPRQITKVPAPSEIFNAESRAIIRGVLAKKTYVQLLISFAIVSFFSYGIASFAVPFFIRSFGVDIGFIGISYGGTAAASSVVGTLSAAFLVDRLAKRDKAWMLRLPGIACLVAVPFVVASILAPSYEICLLFFFIGNSFVSMAIPALFASIYGIIHNSQRSMAIAVFGLAANLLGLGLGPVLIGAISDAITPMFEVEALRYTLAGSVLFLAWAATHILIGSRTINQDYVGNDE
jgi:MFS family permease